MWPGVSNSSHKPRGSYSTGWCWLLSELNHSSRRVKNVDVFRTVAGHEAAVRRAQTGHGKEVNSRLVWSFSLYRHSCGESGQRWVVCFLSVFSRLSPTFEKTRSIWESAAGIDLNTSLNTFIYPPLVRAAKGFITESPSDIPKKSKSSICFIALNVNRENVNFVNFFLMIAITCGLLSWRQEQWQQKQTHHKCWTAFENIQWRDCVPLILWPNFNHSSLLRKGF